MDIRQEIIKQMVENKIGSKGEIEAVISFSFNGINKAVLKHSSIEISGLGSFEFKKKAALQKLSQMESSLSNSSGEEREILAQSINLIKEKI